MTTAESPIDGPAASVTPGASCPAVTPRTAEAATGLAAAPVTGPVTESGPRPATGSAPVAGAAVDRFESSWERDVLWWDVGFYVVVLLSAQALVTNGLPPGRLAVAVVALVVLVLAYTLLGRKAARNRDQRLALAYLLIMITTTTVAVVQDELGTLLLYVAFAQIWMMSERRWLSLVLSTVLASGAAVALASQGGLSREALLETAPQMGVALAFSILLGLWVGQTMLQTARHAKLVDDLHAAQAELGTVHHAAGVAAERERMAREIHDTLAQGFTSVVMLAQAASADLDRDDVGAAQDRLALVEATARDNLAEARSLVTAFAPLPLQGATLVEALERLAIRFEEEAGIPVALRLSPVAGLGSAEDVVLLRSAQEALANVRRHAQATAVVVSLGPGRPETALPDGGTVVLEVADDGRGMGPGIVEGFGLRGMRERVAAGDGTVSVLSSPGGGARVRVELPVPAGHSADPPQSAPLPRSQP